MTSQSQIISSTTTLAVLSGTLANGAYLNCGAGAVIDNRGTVNDAISYDLMDVFINYGTAGLILGSNPSIGFTTLDSPDGGATFEHPGTLSAQPAGILNTKSVPFNAGATLTAGMVLKLPDIPIGDYEFLSLIQNNSGTPWPVGTTITAVRKSLGNW